MRWPFKKKITMLHNPKAIPPINPHYPADGSCIVTDPLATIPIQGPPCPVEIIAYGLCICNKCIHLNKCPMELRCREDACKAVIGGCTIYDSEGDKYVEKKRRIFKDGVCFEPNVFRFCGKKSEESFGRE